MNVVARVADQRDSLGVSGQVGLLSPLVATEQQQRRIVATVEEWSADLATSVEAFEVRPGTAKVDCVRELGAMSQRRAIGGDVVGDELSEQGPAGGGLGRVLAVRTPVTDATGGAKRKQRIGFALERRQVRKEPLIASRLPGHRRVDRPGG